MNSIEYINAHTAARRPGREIKLSSELFRNKNLSFKVGTTDNKNQPKTIYITCSFWYDIKKKSKLNYDDQKFDKLITRQFKHELRKIYSKDLYKTLRHNDVFPLYEDNIYVYNIPSNVNYSDKKSFGSIEMSLHTSNTLSKQRIKTSLEKDENSDMLKESIKLCKIISKSELLNGKLDFNIYKSKR